MFCLCAFCFQFIWHIEKACPNFGYQAPSTSGTAGTAGTKHARPSCYSSMGLLILAADSG
jgi:hypothetical protein